MTEPETIFSRLATMFPEAKKTTLRGMLEAKRVHINGVIAKSLKQPLTEKDKVEVVGAADAPARETLLAEGLRLLHFDADVILVEKPTGLLTATDAIEKRPTTWRILSAWFNRQNAKNKVHLIHRLDRDASGLLVFARNWDAYNALKKQFFEHTITRQYDVLVHGVPKKSKARLENLLLEDERDGGKVTVSKDEKLGKEAILDYEVVGTNRAKTIAHLRCTLFTGRKHQIRVQMKTAGHPVLSDPMYGKMDEAPYRLALHSCKLAFTHPRTDKPVTFESRMPGVMAHLLKQ